MDLPGKPDIVFSRAKLVVFVDGDFWHGKNWSSLKAKLERGHNPEYWVNKIHGNITRDQRRSRELRSAAWEVVRVWESDVINDLVRVVERIKAAKARCELAR